MDTSKKSPSSSENFIYLELGSDGLTKTIELGVLTLEEAEDAQTRYDAFIAMLESEWPPDRLKEYVIDVKRNRYNWVAKKIQELELKNKDERIRGVSFKDRKHYSSKIDVLQKMLEETKQQGIECGKKSFTVKQFVTPLSTDFINKHGFALHLKYATM